MRLQSRKIEVQHSPLQVSGSLTVQGGALVQFYDGVSYVPNREGTPSSPILLTHNVDAANPDRALTGNVNILLSTNFYENGEYITNATYGYRVEGNTLLVRKNTPADGALEIKAISKFVDSRTNKVYERQDSVVMRTIIKEEPQYSVSLSTPKIIYFDGYREPNTMMSVSAQLKRGEEEVTNFEGITFKWKNKDGAEVLDSELYAESIYLDGTVLFVDKAYINKEHIICEVWKDGTMVANASTSIIRKFNSFRTEVAIPELPLHPGTTHITCQLKLDDMVGEIDVDDAFDVVWIVNEWNIDRIVGSGANYKLPVDSIDLKDRNLSIFPDIRRKECYGALCDNNYIYTDNQGRVLTSIIMGE